MTAPPRVRFLARLEPIDQRDRQQPLTGSWFITHGIGTPAGGTFTEVAIDPAVLGDAPRDIARAALEQTVRELAVQLYGDSWAFTYDPQHPPAEPNRRELVVVTWVEVLS